ncbi:MAG: hypothetical protein M3Q09_09430 [Gemmatimonadota bacterium]|nr:hypothetical protein [Gemmatimonadota bacterium]
MARSAGSGIRRMRKTSWIFARLMCAALVPAVADAQRMRDFEDSWFWGVKAGVSTFSPTLGDSEASRHTVSSG